jgi:hypothetical protein
MIEWRSLAAWERPLNCVLWCKMAADARSSGWACDTGEIQIVAGLDAADGYATLLHEMAHVAAAQWSKRIQHSARWRACYLDAAEEVLGERPVPGKMTQVGIDKAVTGLFRQRLAL